MYNQIPSGVSEVSGSARQTLSFPHQTRTMTWQVVYRLLLKPNLWHHHFKTVLEKMENQVKYHVLVRLSQTYFRLRQCHIWSKKRVSFRVR